MGYAHGELSEIEGVLELGGAWYSYNNCRSGAHRRTIEGHWRSNIEGHEGKELPLSSNWSLYSRDHPEQRHNKEYLGLIKVEISRYHMSQTCITTGSLEGVWSSTHEGRRN